MAKIAATPAKTASSKLNKEHMYIDKDTANPVFKIRGPKVMVNPPN
ncbi:hypothetical protein JOC75_002968 [Metabacillus crassostreae]|nr:hypothetical protein [Metabacillus crassostreae]MBM7604964.1 hypothetical protein [Metabacillus crassostreae]